MNDAILVLGGSGFFGRRLVDALAEAGHRVIALARRTPAPSYPANVEVITASLDNSTVIEGLLPFCKAVFHVASDSTPGTTASQPALEAGLNLLPTLRLLESLQKFPRVPLVYLSSGGAIYQAVESGSPDETSVAKPPSYYGAGKIAIESFIHAFTRQHKGRALILRPSNFYGPGQYFRRGFGLIPTLFRHALTDTPASIWGDGEIVRDYIFVDDALLLCTAIAKSSFAFSGFEVCNVGSGTGHTINQVCALVEEIAGTKLKREYLPSRNVDLRRIVLDSTKAKRLFGWEASTGLASGIAMSWDWFKTHGQ
ncbi:MAG: NAD-dependent epimerase/dehydratase family protein [Usitatibacteraceae bacterium]